jgi:hypothetical protein
MTALPDKRLTPNTLARGMLADAGLPLAPLPTVGPSLLPAADMEALWDSEDSESAQVRFLLERNGGMEGLAALLPSPDAGARRQAAWALKVLLLDTSHNRQAFAEIPGCTEKLVALMGGDDEQIVVQAVGAVAGLSRSIPQVKGRVAWIPGCLEQLAALLAHRNRRIAYLAVDSLRDLFLGSNNPTHSLHDSLHATFPGYLLQLKALQESGDPQVRERAHYVQQNTYFGIIGHGQQRR